MFTPSQQNICVSAPGNTMIMGEHAVLFGHMAIVCALKHRLYVTLTPLDSHDVIIHSSIASVQTNLDDIQTIIEPKLAFVLESVRHIAPSKGFILDIKSEFSHTVGLGSSAAVTAACIAALLTFTQKHAPLDEVFDRGLKVIHGVQKRGSGSDLAASVYGGMLSYRAQERQIMPLLDEQAKIEHLPILDLYYSGYKTPTPEVLERVAQSCEQLPEVYQSLYDQMGAISQRANESIKQQNWPELGLLMNIYHGLMDALGVCDAKMAELVYASRNKDKVLGAKISGSGLGDCILTLSKPYAEDHSLRPSSHGDKAAKSPIQPDCHTQIIDSEAHISAHIDPRGILYHEPQ